AIGDLVAAGRLRRVRGQVTFVAPNTLVSRLHLAAFSDEMGAQDVSASSRILLSVRAPAPTDDNNFFHPEARTPDIHLRRSRLGDGGASSIDDGWYSSDPASTLLENDAYNSFYSIFENDFDLPTSGADQTVTAVAADAEVASPLDVT